MHYPNLVDEIVPGLDNWDFDVFDVNARSGGHALPVIGVAVLIKNNLLDSVKILVRSFAAVSAMAAN